MTHAWLITGPPGSGRSVAALCFAAALQCTSDDDPGCGTCRACTTTMAGTHADVRRVIPEGLSIGVDEMRGIVQIASRRPTTGQHQIVVVEDADRLTEGAANALLKVVEEPPPSTVFLLCAPSVDPEDIAITLRSRCRHVALVTPSNEAIAQVLIDGDGLDAETAHWAASVSGGHVGRARRLATDAEARQRRQQALELVRDAARPSRAFLAAEELVAAAEAEAVALTAGRAEAETEELRTALGAGGTGKGAAGAVRGSAGAIKDLERRQKSRQTRASRDALDRALIDLASYFRDAVLVSSGAAGCGPTTRTWPSGWVRWPRTPARNGCCVVWRRCWNAARHWRSMSNPSSPWTRWWPPSGRNCGSGLGCGGGAAVDSGRPRRGQAGRLSSVGRAIHS